MRVERRHPTAREWAAITSSRPVVRRYPKPAVEGRSGSVLLFLYGYMTESPEELDVAAALPFALEDLEGAV